MDRNRAFISYFYKNQNDLHGINQNSECILTMASKTIKITEDVFLLLKKLKKKNENFSELLRRLASQANGKKLEVFFGAWDIEDEEYNNT